MKRAQSNKNLPSETCKNLLGRSTYIHAKYFHKYIKKSENKNGIKFTLKLYDRRITDFHFRSGLNAFIVKYNKKTYLT